MDMSCRYTTLCWDYYPFSIEEFICFTEYSSRAVLVLQDWCPRPLAFTVFCIPNFRCHIFMYEKGLVLLQLGLTDVGWGNILSWIYIEIYTMRYVLTIYIYICIYGSNSMETLHPCRCRGVSILFFWLFTDTKFRKKIQVKWKSKDSWMRLHFSLCCQKCGLECPW